MVLTAPPSPALAGRWRRARAWLALTAGLYIALALWVAVGLYATGIVPRPIHVMTIVFVTVVAPLSIFAWQQRRHPSGHQPETWPAPAVLVPVPTAIAAIAAVPIPLPEGLDTLVRVSTCFLVPAVFGVTAWLTGRALLRPVVAELGETSLHLPVPVRSARQSWVYPNRIVLLPDAVDIHISGGEGRASRPRTVRIPLVDVHGAEVRSAVPADSPWITLPGGRGLSVTPGDVVVLRHREGEWVLPVRDAGGFAGAVLARAKRHGAQLRETSAARSEEPPAPVPGHIPEVLPAPEPFGSPSRIGAGPPEPPVAGPGWGFRAFAGYGTALLGILAVPAGLLIVTGLARVRLQLASGLDVPPDAWQHRAVFFSLWVVAATVLALRSTPRSWPGWAFLGSATSVVCAAYHLGELAPSGGSALLSVAGVWLWLSVPGAVALAYLGGRMLTRPVGADLAASGHEIAIRLPAGERLLVQRDRLLLEPRERVGQVAHGLALAELTFVQPGEMLSNHRAGWPLPGTRTSLERGPALRVVAGNLQWIVQTPHPRELGEIACARAARARPRTDGPRTIAGWHELQTWAAETLTAPRGSGGRSHVQLSVLLVFAFATGFVGTELVSEAVARDVALAGSIVSVVAAAFLAVAATLAAVWYRVRARLRIAEDHPLPPASPAWGDLRPDHAPIEGWQPWSEHPPR